MRRPIIVGNWKMNKGPVSAAALAREVVAKVGQLTAIDVVLAPPFVSLTAVAHELEGSRVGLAAQNLHWEESGAYTSQVSAPMLLEAGCTHVIIGHSERRELFGENDASVNRKVKAALSHDLVPILCIGESLTEREAGQTMARVGAQLHAALNGLSGDQIARIVLAYEPIWAIGTGRTASNEQAQEVHAFLRHELLENYSAQVSTKVRIQYGGSVKPDNTLGLMAQRDIDGALVGGASLTADGFAQIVLAAAKAKD